MIDEEIKRLKKAFKADKFKLRGNTLYLLRCLLDREISYSIDLPFDVNNPKIYAYATDIVNPNFPVFSVSTNYPWSDENTRNSTPLLPCLLSGLYVLGCDITFYEKSFEYELSFHDKMESFCEFNEI